MLSVFPVAQGGAAADPARAVWLDLLDPTAEESATVEAALGASLPSRSALSEIESSSRLRSRDGVLYMSTPTTAHRSAGDTAVAPVGFVLSRERLVTVRFTTLPAFDAVAAK